MNEFNKAFVEGGQPGNFGMKRKRMGEGIFSSDARETGENMYHTLVTRDTTPHGEVADGQPRSYRNLVGGGAVRPPMSNDMSDSYLQGLKHQRA